MKLGDKVKFNKSLIKTNQPRIVYENLNIEQRRRISDGYHLTYRRWKERTHETKEGIICGVRRLTTENTLEYHEEDHTPYGSFEGLVVTDYTEEKVYLVACNLTGFYRVRASDVEEANE